MSNVKVPEGWSIRSLEGNIRILSGFPFKSALFTDDKKFIGIIRIRDLEKQDTETFYSGEYDEAYVVKKGDILIGMDGDFNIVEWKAENALLNQRICKISAEENSDFDTSFLFQSLKEDLLKIHATTGATTVKHLSVKDIREIEKAYPPLPEQQKIATILTSVDTVIEKTRAQIDKLKHLKTAMMQELLTKGIGHTEFKDSSVGRIPKSWEVVQFKEVFTLNYGKSPKEIITKNGANIVWGTGGETAKTNSFLYEGESIVLGRKGTIDQPRYVNGKFWVIDTAYYSSDHGENNVSFLWYVLQMKNLKALNEASGVPSLSRDTLYAEWMALPPPAEQQKIAKILRSAETKLVITKKKLASLKNTKKALMQDLLTGKVRVKTNGINKEY